MLGEIEAVKPLFGAIYKLKPWLYFKVYWDGIHQEIE